MAYAMKIEAMETVIHALEDGRDYMQEMERLRNIDQSCDTLGNMIDEIYTEHPELRREE